MNVSIPDSAAILAAMFLVVCSPFLMLVLQETPRTGEIALVISAPWTSAAEVVEQADIVEIAPERAAFGALVFLDTPQSIERLFAAGAWFVIDGKRVLQLCLI